MTDILWLDELFAEYPVKTKDGRAIRTPDQVQRLKKLYADYSPDVMLEAVHAYMLVGHYFPKPADLYEHVQMAQENHRGDVDYKDEGDAIYYGRWRSDHVVPVTDDELFEFEQARNWSKEATT